MSELEAMLFAATRVAGTVEQLMDKACRTADVPEEEVWDALDAAREQATLARKSLEVAQQVVRWSA